MVSRLVRAGAPALLSIMIPSLGPACSSTNGRCTAGRQVACDCLGGSTGVQVCASDGSGYGTCACADASEADASMEVGRDSATDVAADETQDVPIEGTTDVTPHDGTADTPPKDATTDAGIDASADDGSSYGTLTRFPLPTDASSPFWIVSGPDGNLWFTEQSSNKIGRITVTGIITEFPIPTVASYPYGIAAGPDGNLWFTEQHANKIGVITTTGQISEWSLAQSALGIQNPSGITACPDGRLWYAPAWAGTPPTLGAITTTGTASEYGLGSPCDSTVTREAIACDTAGNVFAVLDDGGNGYVARVSPPSMCAPITPNVGYVPHQLAYVPDGTLWFTYDYLDEVYRMTTTGAITHFKMPVTPYSNPSGDVPQSVGAAPGGGVWASTALGVLRVTAAGAMWYITDPSAMIGSASCVTTGPDGNVWFTETDANYIGRVTP